MLGPSLHRSSLLLTCAPCILSLLALVLLAPCSYIYCPHNASHSLLCRFFSPSLFTLLHVCLSCVVLTLFSVLLLSLFFAPLSPHQNRVSGAKSAPFRFEHSKSRGFLRASENSKLNMLIFVFSPEGFWFTFGKGAGAGEGRGAYRAL